jgi:hypothetical protein
LNINKELEELDDDLITEQRKEDYKTELSQIALVQDCKMPEINLLGQQEVSIRFLTEEMLPDDPYYVSPNFEEGIWTFH